MIFNVYNTVSKTTTNVITGIEIYNKNFIYPYFTSTNLNVIRSDNYIFFISFIVFLTNVCLSLMKLIYHINYKFQIVAHLCALLHEVINLLLIFFLYC